MPYLIFILLFINAWPLQAEGEPALRIATWNLEHLAAGNGDGCRPRTNADYARLRYYAERLGADLIGLQEVEDEAAVARVFNPNIYAIEISSQPDRDLGTCRRQRSRRRTMQRTGFAINRIRMRKLGLSYRRLPDLEAIGLEYQRWATGILIEPVEGKGESIRLLSLHLKSGCAFGKLDGKVDRSQCRLLRRQRGILEEWIDGRASDDERYILLGDFNRQLDQPHDDFWAEIDDGIVCVWMPDPVLGRRCRPGTTQSEVDATLVLANAGRPFPFSFNPRYPYAVDHILLDPVTAERIVPGSYRVLDYKDTEPAPSDHHPVSISLRP